MNVRWLFPLLFTTFLFTGCGKPRIDKVVPRSVVLAFGDSLTSGFGADERESYPTVLASKLGCRVVNAGISGEDTESALARLPDVLEEHRPDLVILCSGGNDMLRMDPPGQVESNLRQMMNLVKRSGADQVLVGVPKPGALLNVPDFYRELAKELDVPFEGKALKRILTDPNLKSDPIHPNAEGYAQLAGDLLKLIRKSGK